MARQAASARSTPQGKGKKAGPSVKISTKRAKSKRAQKPTRARRPASRSTTTHLDAIVRVGTAITFAPTGERLRVAKIENGQITFEKLP